MLIVIPEILKMKIIPNFSMYRCNEYGDIFDTSGNIVKQTKNHASSYKSVWVQKDGDDFKSSRHVHRLVVSAYFGEIGNDMVVDHIDQNKSNNHVDNLEVVSVSENNRRSVVSKNSTTPSIAVVATSDNENTRTIYRSIAEASASTGISEYMIKKMCDNSSVHIHKNPHITFNYLHHGVKNDFSKEDFMRKIYVYDIIRETYNEYSSISECIKSTGLSKSVIHSRLDGNFPSMLFPTMGYIISNSKMSANDIPTYSAPEIDLFKILRNNGVLGRTDGAGIVININDSSYEPVWSLRKYCSDNNLHREYFKRNSSERIYGLRYIPFYTDVKTYSKEFKNYLEKNNPSGSP